MPGNVWTSTRAKCGSRKTGPFSREKRWLTVSGLVIAGKRRAAFARIAQYSGIVCSLLVTVSKDPPGRRTRAASATALSMSGTW